MHELTEKPCQAEPKPTVLEVPEPPRIQAARGLSIEQVADLIERVRAAEIEATQLRTQLAAVTSQLRAVALQLGLKAIAAMAPAE